VGAELQGAAGLLPKGRELDAVIITAPSDEAVRAGHGLVRGGGAVLLFAHTHRGNETAMDLSRVCVDEKDVLGSYSADVQLQPEVARLVFRRKLDVRGLISHRFPLGEGPEAIRLATRPTAESLKIFVVSDAGE
jgi:L-iditol 2-dehydrogenase